MNEERCSAKRLPDSSVSANATRHHGAQRAWEREVRDLSDEELRLCVRAQVAVDRAVEHRRKARPAGFAAVPA